MNLKILNLEPPEPRFILQNLTLNLPNHPKKTEPQTSNQVHSKSILSILCMIYVRQLKNLYNLRKVVNLRETNLILYSNG